MSDQANEYDINSKAFRLTELRSECIRVAATLVVFGGLLALVLIRAITSLANGLRGEAWPFGLLLAVFTAYELVWLRFVKRALKSAQAISKPTWVAGILAESLLPTIALVLQLHTSLIGPHRALTSPVVHAYFLLIILSTLHLDSGLSRTAGALSAGGYAAVSAYTVVRFPEAAAYDPLVTYGTWISYAVFLLLGGFAAGAVAQQIRLYVIRALREAESQAKIAALEHDLDIARSIQQGLLPKVPPQAHGFDIAGWNKPADETGGDYFDWQQLPDGRVAVMIADVTGHGIGPALCMAACRAYARAGLLIETDPGRFLTRLNQLLYEDLPSEKFVTMGVGLLDPAEGTLHLISAGHGPLLFFSSAEGQIRRYDAQGPPLGILPRLSYGGAQTLKFASGDILVLVTDGFIEWANAKDEEFGQNRLEEVIRECRDLPPENILSELYSRIVRFAGSMPQPDDLTVLVVKRA
jgi:serine phosphatase RsbU (regulator of sigma subunit)